MNVKNCTQCGQIFAYAGKPICPKCIAEEEKEFIVVREYLLQNPGANVVAVSEETGISEKKIMRYLKEGRLQLTPGQAGISLTCERCDTTIYSGRFCDKCVKQMSREFKAGLIENKEETDDYNEERLSIKRQGTIYLKNRITRER